MKNLYDIANVVLRLHNHGQVREIVVRQDRLMPITYVERHYHDVIEVTAQMMPHGQERIFTGEQRLTHHVMEAYPDSMVRVYSDLRRKIMDVKA